MRAMNIGPGYTIWQLQHRLQRRLEREMAPIGVTLAQASALARLEAEPGLSSAKLARHLFLTPQAVSLMTARLESDGYLRRGPASGRSTPLLITASGRRVLDRAERAVLDVRAQIFGTLNDAEQSRLGALLDRCLVAADQPAEPNTAG